MYNKYSGSINARCIGIYNGKSIEEVLEEINIKELTPSILTKILQSKELFDKVQDRLIQEKEGN